MFCHSRCLVDCAIKVCVVTMFTRTQHVDKKAYNREMKRKQYETEEGRLRNNEASKRCRQNKKIQCECLMMEVENLRKKVASLERKINKLMEVLREKDDHGEILESCLEKQRQDDLLILQ